MRFGGITVLPEIQVGDHRIIGIRNRGRMAPGVFCIQKRIVSVGPNQFFIMNTGLFLQAVADTGETECFFEVFYRIGRTAHAIAPPVIHASLINRRILYLLPNPFIQFLQRNHMKRYILPVTAVKFLHRIRNHGINRCIVRKNSGNTGNIKIIRIAILFIFCNAVSQILIELFEILFLFFFFRSLQRFTADVFSHHDSKYISKVVMFSVPDKETFSFFVFPEKRGLILIERIHSMMCMNIHIQKFHTISNQCISLPQGNSVDIRAHRCLHGNAFPLTKFHHTCQFLIQILTIRQIVKVQIICRKPHISKAHRFPEICLFFLGCPFQKLFHAVPRLTVPLQILLGRAHFPAFHDPLYNCTDIVGLVKNHLLLQIRVSHIRVGMMYDVDFFYFLSHSLFFLRVIK